MRTWQFCRVWSLGILVLLAGSGCVGLRSPHVFAPAGDGGALRLGSDGPVLEEGDIILSRRNNVLSAMFAKGGAVVGPYGHAAMFCRNQAGKPVILHIVENGLQCPEPNTYLVGAVHVAVVRYRGGGVSAKLGAAARSWIARDAAHPLKFDLAFKEANDDANQFSCMGLVNQIHEQAGLPTPFRLARPADMDRWFTWVLDELEWNLSRMPTASSVLANPEFAVVGEWWNPGIPRARVQVDDVFAESLREFVLVGYVPGKPAFGPRCLYGSLRGCGILPEAQEKRALARSLLGDYAVTVHEIMRRWFDERPAGEWTEDAVRAQVRRVSETLRSDYFVPVRPPTAQPAPGRR